MKAEVEPKVAKDGDNTAYFQSLERKFNRKKKRYEEQLMKDFQKDTTYRAEDYSDAASHTSVMQKALKSIF